MSQDSATDALLVQYHSACPEATPLTFRRFVSPSEGLDSYGLCVAAAAPWTPAGAVLDLGCGGGSLLQMLDARRHIGVDLTPAQIERARLRLGEDAELHAAGAHQLPLADGSVDLVTSHMALMLMQPIDAVVAELGRVLRPGGGVVVVVGGRRPDDPTTQAVVQAFWAALDALDHDFVSHRLGDRRTRTAAGLRGLFADLLEALEVREHALYAEASVEEHWGHLAGMYNVWELSDAQIEAVRAAVCPVMAGRAVDGRLRVGMTVQVLVGRRLGGAPSTG